MNTNRRIHLRRPNSYIPSRPPTRQRGSGIFLIRPIKMNFKTTSQAGCGPSCPLTFNSKPFIFIPPRPKSKLTEFGVARQRKRNRGWGLHLKRDQPRPRPPLLLFFLVLFSYNTNTNLPKRRFQPLFSPHACAYPCRGLGLRGHSPQPA